MKPFLKLILALILTSFVVGLNSCRKDPNITDKLIADSDDGTRDIYIGAWKFKSTFYHTYGDYVWVDDNGTPVQVWQWHTNETVNWESETGSVSKGLKTKELIIQYSPTHSAYSVLTDSLGYLSCNGDCSGVGFFDVSNPTSGWQITDSSYYLNLGGNSGYQWSNKTVITGVKL